MKLSSVRAMSDDDLRLELGNELGKTEWYLSFEFLPDYCKDTAASLEVQAKAIEIDDDLYVRELGRVRGERYAEYYKTSSIAKILNASPRERAEAAYLTFKNRGAL